MPAQPSLPPSEPTSDATTAEVAGWVLESELQDWERLVAAVSEVIEGVVTWEGTRCEDDYQLAGIILDGEPSPLLNLGLRQALFRLAAMSELLQSLLDVVRHAPHRVVSVATLVRSITESGVHIAHILDSKATSETRICRVVLYTVDEDALATAREFEGVIDPESGWTTAQARALGLVRELVSYGFTLKAAGSGSNGKVTKVTYQDGVASNAELRITQLFTAYFPDGERIYSLLSGAVHGRLWFLRTYLGDEASDETNLGGLISALVRISDSLTGHICDYFGLDPAQYATNKHARRELLIETARRASPPRDQPEDRSA